MEHRTDMSDAPLFPVTHEETFGLTTRDLLRAWFKYWPTVMGCLVLVTVLTWGLLFVLPSTYESSAKVWVQTEQQGTPSFLSGIAAYRESQVPESVDRKIETEIQLLLSRSNVDAVVTRLGIEKAQLVQAPADYLRADLPGWLRGRNTKTPAQLHNETVELFIKGITVDPLRSKTAETTSNVLQARFECADKALAPRALAALLQEYIQFGSQHNRDLGKATYSLVDSNIHQETVELKKLDDQILALTVKQASRADVSPDPGTAAARSDRTGSRTGAASSLSLLKSEAIEMQAKLEEARQLFTEESPNVRHLEDQLLALRGRLRSGVRASAELDAKLDRLDRQRSLALLRFNELRTKRDQIDLYLHLMPVVSDSRLVTETPLQPERAKLKTKIVVGALGPLAGLLIGLMTAGLREYFDHRLQSAEDVKRHLGLETLGIVPKAA